MKMVTRGKPGSRTYCRCTVETVSPDVCVCLVCTFPQPILNSNNRSPFFCSLAMHTVDSSTCWVSVFIGAGTFNTKYLHLPLVILIIITFVVALCYYGFEYSEHRWDQDAETVEHPISYRYRRRKRKRKVWQMLASSPWTSSDRL